MNVRYTLTIIAATLALAMLTPSAAMAKPSHSVKGHMTKKGTYVAPYRATNRDNSKLNNWSTKGNVNPYTGKKGTKKL